MDRSVLLLLMGATPILAYLLLLGAHAALVVRHSPPTKRVTRLIEAAILAAYGMMISFYMFEVFSD
jgi:hypothetical protein